MPTRRVFLQAAAGAVLLAAAGGRAAETIRIEAVCFDAFVLFDPRPIGTVAEEVAPNRGRELVTAWRTRQFEYCWLRSLGGPYADFWQITQDALDFAVEQLKLDLPAAHRQRLLDAHLQLKAWPDVAEGLKSLKSAGVRVAILSNFGPKMLDAAVAASGLNGRLDAMLSTDMIRSYKPDARAYQLGVDRLKLSREQICFAAFAGWDVAGAKWFGYPTFWVNRLSSPPERLDAKADASGAMPELVKFVTG